MREGRVVGRERITESEGEKEEELRREEVKIAIKCLKKRGGWIEI